MYSMYYYPIHSLLPCTEKRLPWPLRKDDTHKSRSVNNFFAKMLYETGVLRSTRAAHCFLKSLILAQGELVWLCGMLLQSWRFLLRNDASGTWSQWGNATWALPCYDSPLTLSNTKTKCSNAIHEVCAGKPRNGRNSRGGFSCLHLATQPVNTGRSNVPPRGCALS